MFWHLFYVITQNKCQNIINKIIVAVCLFYNKCSTSNFMCIDCYYVFSTCNIMLIERTFLCSHTKKEIIGEFTRNIIQDLFVIYFCWYKYISLNECVSIWDYEMIFNFSVLCMTTHQYPITNRGRWDRGLFGV